MKLAPFDRCERVSVSADMRREGSRIEFDYRISGDIGDVVLPAAAEVAGRAEQLWGATCFHAFVTVGKTTYWQFDFSPSGEWAARQFTDYRHGMTELDLCPPQVRFAEYRLTATLDLPPRASLGAKVGLAATLEHRNGSRSYWALAHVSANRPDLHARDCFVAQLP